MWKRDWLMNSHVSTKPRKECLQYYWIIATRHIPANQRSNFEGLSVRSLLIITPFPLAPDFETAKAKNAAVQSITQLHDAAQDTIRVIMKSTTTFAEIYRKATGASALDRTDFIMWCNRDSAEALSQTLLRFKASDKRTLAGPRSSIVRSIKLFPETLPSNAKDVQSQQQRHVWRAERGMHHAFHENNCRYPFKKNVQDQSKQQRKTWRAEHHITRSTKV